ncbi:hypothetical protein Acsp04_46440 [Actinomadura sp. NBRC 104425]|nr:hypothetical protein Acsp04_46440 [Actinomadura sp. NBRC 104425]
MTGSLWHRTDPRTPSAHPPSAAEAPSGSPGLTGEHLREPTAAAGGDVRRTASTTGAEPAGTVKRNF